jgi:menaquinone-dependent protoporphyrinogen oxidase
MDTGLVAYATKRGSTREVAAEVARIIRQSGPEVEISPAREVKSLDRYGAVVLGGALYMGRWHKDARRLLKRYRSELASLPLAVFALGPPSWHGRSTRCPRCIPSRPRSSVA